MGKLSPVTLNSMLNPQDQLERIFNPQTIAVIGATNKKGHVGNALMENLIAGGFKGQIYPVNPHRKRISNLKVYPTINDVPEKVDLALVATPAPTVPKIARQCGQAEVAGLIIISSGFKESGKEGKALYKRLLRVVQKYPTRVIGPNCLGFLRPSQNLNASFALQNALPGHVAFISQSGALGASILDWSLKQGIGFSFFISIGDMIDVGFSHLIDFINQDPNTSSILLYVETIEDCRRFMSAARAFSRSRPVFVLKAGKSKEGARAALSHTGSIAGDSMVFEAALERVGALRVSRLEELFDCTHSLAMQKLPPGNRLAIVTNAGGPAVIATDILVERGGRLADISPETQQALRKVLPPAANVVNPVDILGDADAQRYREAVRSCLEDLQIDGVLVILAPQAMTNPTAVAETLATLPNRQQKTLLASWMGGEEVVEGIKILTKAKIPAYQFPERAVETFINMYTYKRNQELLQQTPGTIPSQFTPDLRAAKRLIRNVVSKGRYILTEEESKKLLSYYDFPIPESILAKNIEQSVRAARKIGFPVAMKIAVPNLLHKTEYQGVKLNISSENAVRVAFSEIRENFYLKTKTRLSGVLVEEMIKKRYELFLGCKKDSLFGPIILFGKGGVDVEVFQDISTALPPLNMKLAQRLLEETKIYTLLKGYRGLPATDLKALQFLLYKFAYLVVDCYEIAEIDINPFSVDETGGVVLDAKIILDKTLAQKEIEPYSHLVISPYPREYEKRVRLKNGQDVLVRPVRPEDGYLYAKFFQAFPETTKHFHSFLSFDKMFDKSFAHYTQIDYDREIALIAIIQKGKKEKIMGVVRLVSDPDRQNAEFTLVVGDTWQDQDLEAILTNNILKIAQKRGIKTVYAYVKEDDLTMIHLLKKRHFHFNQQEGILQAELSLK